MLYKTAGQFYRKWKYPRLLRSKHFREIALQIGQTLSALESSDTLQGLASGQHRGPDIRLAHWVGAARARDGQGLSCWRWPGVEHASFSLGQR